MFIYEDKLAWAMDTRISSFDLVILVLPATHTGASSVGTRMKAWKFTLPFVSFWSFGLLVWEKTNFIDMCVSLREK